MILRDRARSGGFSLVELLVVMAIVAILMGISVPILQMFSQNDMDRGARSLYTMLRAARVYASTFNVRTAVVYQLDSRLDVVDSLRREPVRMLVSATVLYQLPEHMGSYKGLYVPTPEYGGEFQPFPLGYAVPFDTVPIDYRMPPERTPVYRHGVLPTDGLPAEAPDPNLYYSPVFNVNIGKLGMKMVEMYDAPIDPLPSVREAEYSAFARVPFVAHVFDTGGKLVTDDSASATVQRFSILFAPAPDRPVGERTWSEVNADDAVVDLWWSKTAPEAAPQMGLVGIPIEIYRSTGRVRMGSL